MTSQVLLLLSTLVTELQLKEFTSLQNGDLIILDPSTPHDRIRYLIDNLPLPSLFLDLFLAAYSKVCVHMCFYCSIKLP